MASGYTANYGLCQWQGSDAFLREEFNGDNAKIDAALGGLRRGVDAAGYNVYNLILQNYYEGKYTGFKRGLMFDGFLDESGIAGKDEALVVRDRALLGIGLMLSAGEIPRIAGQFGLETGTRANVMGAVYAAQHAVNLTRTIVQTVAK